MSFKMILAGAKKYSVAVVLFFGIWMGGSLSARAVLMAYGWPPFHSVMIEILMFIQFISCVLVVLKSRSVVPAILLLIGAWQFPILIDAVSGYHNAVDTFGAKFLLVVMMLMPILIACWARGGDALPGDDDHVEAA